MQNNFNRALLIGKKCRIDEKKRIYRYQNLELKVLKIEKNSIKKTFGGFAKT